MAAEIDPKTEALVRQLHRELNGLTRTSRRANATYGLSFDSTGAAKQQQPQRDKETRSEGTGVAGALVKRQRTEKERDRERERDRDRGRTGTYAGGSGSHRKRTPPPATRQRQRRVRGIDDSDNAASDEERKEEGEADSDDSDDEDEEQVYQSTRTSSGSEESRSESELQVHKRHKGGSNREDRDGSKGDRDGGKQREREHERQRDLDRRRERERERDREQRTAGPMGTPTNPPSRCAIPARTDPGGSSRKGEPLGAQQPSIQDARDPDRSRGQAVVMQVRDVAGTAGGLAAQAEPGLTRAAAQQQQLQQQMVEQQLSPLEAAAAAASGAVKEQAKALGQVADNRFVKCFHAGVRWGIKLSRQALQTRSDLATALNDAFAGEILSCGRGETLFIVFLDAQGKATEFPSLRGPNGRGKDSATKWRAM
ncbi:hypothetical protein VOLCADRAFT_103388, partial [Volvox carteri f. nagariensis]